MAQPIVWTRLAPSPTGALHLGNARTFLINWLLARQQGWKILLRIEDLDGPRVKRDADRQAMTDLAWLGLDWDAGPVYQSTRAERYQAAVDQLLHRRLAYPCVCSRKDVDLAASAPHAQDGSALYPGTCRDRFDSVEQARAESGKEPAIRFRAEPRVVEFLDGFRGPQRLEIANRIGDFVIRKSDGVAAYQLAVVIDDAEMNIAQVVRGEDLLESTARQILLYEAMGLADRLPRYTHLPLVVGPDGRRLAKRHGDSRLATYRDRGVGAERVLALLGRWCGMAGLSRLDEMIGRFQLDAVSPQPCVFTDADDCWLGPGSG